ncbi:MAG: electron transfer flavoprotein subunit beta/FixA family protein [Acetobacteraceae bacterium]|nr:electron transfer flavoprotein subunit beta/FixA family protein [Acetobacteraceae bacterium]
MVVLVKHVPDTEARIAVAGGGRSISEEGINFVLNPYDEFAVEEALRLKERLGGQVTVVTLGPERAKEALRTALAMGADEAVHLRDDALEGGDALSVSVALARALKDIPFDLILCGKQAIDDDSCQVGPRVAELLGIPQVTVVTKLEVDAAARTARAQREMDGYSEVVETPLPALVSAQKGLNEPRFPSLPGIMKAKRKEIKTLNLASLGLDASQVGRAGQGAEVQALEVPSRARRGRILTSDPPAAAAELAALLRGEAKVL